MVPHGMPRHPSLRVPRAMPVELQQGLRWLAACLDAHRMQHRPPSPFFAGC